MSSTDDRTEGGGQGLAGLVEGVRTRLFRRAALAVGLWLLVAVVGALGLAWVLSGPGGWEAGSAGPLVLDLTLLAVAVAGTWWLVRRVRRRLTDERLGAALDRIGGFGKGTVLGSLELSRETPPGSSPALARSSEEKVLRALSDDSRRLADRLGAAFRRWTRRGAGFLAFGVAVLVLLAVGSPDRTASAWRGLVRPAATLASPPLPALRVEPVVERLPRGSDLEVRVEAPGRERVRLSWQFDGDVARGREAPVKDGRARFALGSLEAPVEYQAVAPDGARSQRVRIVPEDPLLVTDLRVELTFPPHTGRPPRQFRRDVPPLEVPAGTTVRVDGRASRPLGAAGLRRSGADGSEGGGAELDVEGDRFSGRWTPRRGGTYEWILRGRDGTEPASVPTPLEVRLVQDSLPSVEIARPGRDTVLPLDRRQQLVIRAADDYGLRSLELVAYRVSSVGERDEPVVRSLRAGGVRAAVARPVLDVSEWELLPGDTVRYRARVVDNAPEPQRVESREYTLSVAGRSEVSRALQERLESATRAVDSLATEARRAAEQTRDLERRGTEPRRNQRAGTADRPGSSSTSRSRSGSSARGETSFESREEVRRAVERQQELLAGADSVGSSLSETRKALEEAALADPELRSDLQELQSLMEQVATPEERSELSRTAEELGEMDRRALEKSLERLARNQEELRESLEQSLQRFRRAAAEQEFRTAAREARELADEESALADAMEEEDGEGEERGAMRAQQQQQMAESASELQERMDSLEQSLSRLGEQEARQGVQEARQGTGEASQEMERAGRMSRRQRMSEAARAAQSAAGKLQRSADRLDSAEQRMARQRQDETRSAFRRASTEALSLARRQAELQERMRGASSDEQAELRRDEAAVLEGLRNLSENLSRPATRSSQGGREVQSAVRRATESVQQTLQSLQGQGGRNTPSPSAASTEAVKALNQAARSAARMGRQPGGQQGGGQGGQLQQQLQKVARQQGGLARKAGSLRPMQLGPSSLKRQLGQMASEQEAVASRLGELSRRPGSGEALGDLQRMADEARKLARELEGDRLEPETVRRQERLFHRLLDAGRSLEKEERSTEREARRAEQASAAEVAPLTAESVGGARFSLPRAEVLRALPPAQRALVVRYFERLNRGGERAPGGGGGARP